MKKLVAIMLVVAAVGSAFGTDFFWRNSPLDNPYGFGVYYNGDLIGPSEPLTAYLIYLGKNASENTAVTYADMTNVYLAAAVRGFAHTTVRDALNGAFVKKGADTWYWDWNGDWGHDGDFQDGDSLAMVIEYDFGEFKCYNMSTVKVLDADAIGEITPETTLFFSFNWDFANGSDHWASNILAGAGWSASTEHQSVTEVKYKLVLNYGDDTKYSTTNEYNFGDSVQLPSCTLPLRGWTFSRSWRKAGGDVVKGVGEFVTIGDDMEFNAEWTANLYSLAYVMDCDVSSKNEVLYGYIKEGANPNVYAVTNADITLQRAYRFGYIFEGWTGPDVETPTLDVTIPANSISNRQFVAHWSRVDVSTVRLETSDLDDVLDLSDYPVPCALKFTLEEDIGHGIYISPSVTNLTIAFNGHTISTTDEASAILYGNDAMRVRFEGSGGIRAAGSNPSTMSAMSAFSSFSHVSAGASGLAEGAKVALGGVERTGGGWTVSFSVELQEGEDFNNWLAASKLSNRILLAMAPTPSGFADGTATYVRPSVDLAAVSGDAESRTVSFFVAPPEELSESCFFKVEIK